ncbi:MAG: 30S ribosomal protein S6 [Cytophagales bacterium]|nr:MAG: 30S ribosomal protein S6 [Cytophagales bacterium]TAF61940.1 MAG: 30S ribosomal protein S6 [Cytophagales bacterium]
MALRNYETVFIVNPVLSEAQYNEVRDKFKKILEQNGANISNDENWGLMKFAYTMQGKQSGFYTYLEFKAAPQAIATLNTEFRRDDRVMRFLTVSLDKHAIAYNEKRRSGAFKKKETDTKPTSNAVESK